jgi:hypothetical protein
MLKCASRTQPDQQPARFSVLPAQALEAVEPADDRFAGNMESGFVPLGDAAAKPNFGFCSLTIVHPLLTDLCQRFRSAFHTTCYNARSTRHSEEVEGTQISQASTG